jgi:NAD(P)-dependent dehydrogenase (short-subunit alcohol dehydrogenase family)
MTRRICLLTGAGGKLGSVLLRELAQEYDVVATYRHTVPQINSQLMWRVGSSTEPTASIFLIKSDLQKREDMVRMVELALAKHGQIDIVVNCAADVRFHGKLVESWTATDLLAGQLRVNCIAPMMIVSLVHDLCWKDAPDENAQRNRSVLNVSSLSGLYAYGAAGQGFYSASKAALNMLSLHLALELAPYSVRVNAICPPNLDDPTRLRATTEAIKRSLEGDGTGEIMTGLEEHS